MPSSKASAAVAKVIAGPVAKAVPERWRETFLLRTFSLLKIPMINWVSPFVVELSTERCEIRIPLLRKNKNHLRSMYFGVLCTGADCAGGLIAMRMIQEEGDQVNLIFKDFHANFLKRAEGDTHFTCTDGNKIRELVKRAITSGERESMPVHITATVPSKLGPEPVAQFTLTLSLKKKSKLD